MAEESRGLTRREVVRCVAAAGAVTLIDPGVALARARRDGVFSRRVGTLRPGEAVTIALPQGFSLVGVEWAAPARPRIDLRARASGGRWSAWVCASAGGHDPDGPPAEHRRFGEPIWTGPADAVQVGSRDLVQGVRLHFVSPSAAPPTTLAHATAIPDPPLAQPVLDAGPGQPPIIARAAWAGGHAPPRHTPEYGTIKLAFVHHSETPNGYGAAQVPSILRSIFAYHRYVRDYFDIGYNFAVDGFGRIWEARAGGIDQAVVGAHAGGYNTESTGVVVLGSFSAAAPSGAALAALERLLAWKLALHGVPALGRVSVEVSPDGAPYTAFAPGSRVSLPRIAGHRDGDQTSCPGDALYARIPSLRPRAAQLAGNASRLTIAAPVDAVTPGTAVTVAGRLSDLASGAPVVGAPIEIQRITGTATEATLATLGTDAGGAWSYAVAPAQNTLLRALQRAAPAAVSDVVLLAVAPAVTLSVDSLAPLVVSGTVMPAGPRVTIDVYRLGARASRKAVASTQIATAADGTFRSRIKRPGRGGYVVLARTAGGTRYAAGGSPGVPIVIR